MDVNFGIFGQVEVEDVRDMVDVQPRAATSVATSTLIGLHQEAVHRTRLLLQFTAQRLGGKTAH